MFVRGLGRQVQKIYAYCDTEQDLLKELKDSNELCEFIKIALKPAYSNWRSRNSQFMTKILVKLLKRQDVVPLKLQEIGRLSAFHLGKTVKTKVSSPSKIYALVLQVLSCSEFVTKKAGVIDLKEDFFIANKACAKINYVMLDDPEQLRYAVLLSRLFDKKIEEYLGGGVENIGLGFFKYYNLRVDEKNIESILRIAFELKSKPLISRCLYYLNSSFLPISARAPDSYDLIAIRSENDLFFLEIESAKSDAIERIQKMLSWFPPEKIWIRLGLRSDFADLENFIQAFPDKIIEIKNSSGCYLKRLPNISHLKNLQSLNLKHAQFLTFPPDLRDLKQLSHVSFKGCTSLLSPPLMYGATGISHLSFALCTKMMFPPDLEGLESLHTLNFAWCENLIDLPYLCSAAALQNLNIRKCPKVPRLRCLQVLVGFIMMNPKHNLSVEWEKNDPALKFYCELFETKAKDKDNLPVIERLMLAHDWMANVDSSSFFRMIKKIDLNLEVRLVEKILWQDKTFQRAAEKKFKGATFEEYVMAINFGVPLPQNNRFHQLLYENSKKAPFLLEGLYRNAPFEDVVRYFLSTYEGRDVIEANNSDIFFQCPYVFHHILKQYPPKNLANNNLYPMSFHALKSKELLVYCTHGHLKTNPKNILSLLTKKLVEGSFFCQMRVLFFGEPGHDASGLTRDFLGLLCENLAVELQLQQGVPDWAPHRDRDFINLGLLFKYLLGVKMPVGKSFSPELFTQMLAFTDEEIADDFEKIKPETLFNLYGNKLAEKAGPSMLAVLKNIKAILAWNGAAPTSKKGREIISFIETQYDSLCLDFPAGLDVENGRLTNYAQLPEFLGELKEVLAISVIEPYVNMAKTAHAVGKGMNYSPAAWKKLQAKGPYTMQKAILGRLSKRMLKKAFDFRAGVDAETQACILEWIDSRDDEYLRKFLKYLTGTAALPSKKIKVFAKEGLCDFEVSTCFTYINVPANMQLLQANAEDYEGPVESLKERIFRSLDYFCSEETGFTLR